MRISILKGIPAGLLLLAVPAFGSVHPKTGTSTKHTHVSVKEDSVRHKKGLHLHFAREEKAPMEIPSERATQIQSALIKLGLGPTDAAAAPGADVALGNIKGSSQEFAQAQRQQ